MEDGILNREDAKNTKEEGRRKKEEGILNREDAFGEAVPVG